MTTRFYSAGDFAFRVDAVWGVSIVKTDPTTGAPFFVIQVHGRPEPHRLNYRSGDESRAKLERDGLLAAVEAAVEVAERKEAKAQNTGH